MSSTPKAFLERTEAQPRRRRPRVFQQIVDEIRSEIFRRRLSPGDRLPHEAALAERFSVSRPAVREALRVLELQGLVRVEHGFRGGTFVNEAGITPVTQALETMFRLERDVGVCKMRLITDKSKNIVCLDNAYNLEVVERVPIEPSASRTHRFGMPRSRYRSNTEMGHLRPRPHIQ